MSTPTTPSPPLPPSSIVVHNPSPTPSPQDGNQNQIELQALVRPSPSPATTTTATTTTTTPPPTPPPTPPTVPLTPSTQPRLTPSTITQNLRKIFTVLTLILIPTILSLICFLGWMSVIALVPQDVRGGGYGGSSDLPEGGIGADLTPSELSWIVEYDIPSPTVNSYFSDNPDSLYPPVNMTTSFLPKLVHVPPCTLPIKAYAIIALSTYLYIPFHQSLKRRLYPLSYPSPHSASARLNLPPRPRSLIVFDRVFNAWFMFVVFFGVILLNVGGGTCGTFSVPFTSNFSFDELIENQGFGDTNIRVDSDNDGQFYRDYSLPCELTIPDKYLPFRLFVVTQLILLLLLALPILSLPCLFVYLIRNNYLFFDENLQNNNENGNDGNGGGRGERKGVSASVLSNFWEVQFGDLNEILFIGTKVKPANKPRSTSSTSLTKVVKDITSRSYISVDDIESYSSYFLAGKKPVLIGLDLGVGIDDVSGDGGDGSGKSGGISNGNVIGSKSDSVEHAFGSSSIVPVSSGSFSAKSNEVVLGDDDIESNVNANANTNANASVVKDRDDLLECCICMIELKLICKPCNVEDGESAKKSEKKSLFKKMKKSTASTNESNGADATNTAITTVNAIDRERYGKRKVIITPCAHCFHYDCIEIWLKNKTICPLCRADFSVDERIGDGDDNNYEGGDVEGEAEGDDNEVDTMVSTDVQSERLYLSDITTTQLTNSNADNNNELRMQSSASSSSLPLPTQTAPSTPTSTSTSTARSIINGALRSVSNIVSSGDSNGGVDERRVHADFDADFSDIP